MLQSAPASPVDVTLPLLCDRRNTNALLTHLFALPQPEDADERKAAVWGAWGRCIADPDAQRAFLAAAAITPLADVDGMTDAYVVASSLFAMHSLYYRETADPATFPCELPGMTVTIRGVSDWQRFDTDARRALRAPQGGVWRMPALGATVSQRIARIARQAAHAGRLGGDYDACRARELDALTGEERDAVDAHSEWSDAYYREMAARLILRLDNAPPGVPEGLLAADGPMFDVGALLDARWTVTHESGAVEHQRMAPASVAEMCAEVTNLAERVFAAGKGPGSQRA